MASSSSSIPSTHHDKKVNDPENRVKPVPKPVSHGSIMTRNLLTSLKPGKWSLRRSKTEKPTKNNRQKSDEDSKAKETQEEEEARIQRKFDKEKKQSEKQVEAILNSIQMDFSDIQNTSRRIKNRESTFMVAMNKFEELTYANASAEDLLGVKKFIYILKQRTFSHDVYANDDRDEEALVNQIHAMSNGIRSSPQLADTNYLGVMPNLFDHPDFVRTLPFQDFEALFNELPFELKLCLLCFSVFPDNVEIKRTIMVYWWIGEGFVPPVNVRPEESTNQQHWEKFDLKKISPSDNDFTAEQWANHYFKVLLKMGFIEAAQRNPNSKVNLCKMHPFVRSMVNRIAHKAKFFEFDPHGNVNEKFSKSLRACLLNGETFTEDDSFLKKIHAVFNVDETILDFKKDSLSKMRNTNILYLGRWQSLGTHYIEIDDTRILDAKKGSILDGLQSMKSLKFLGLQGISRITELPKSISKLENLTILDIKACYNLEKIPNDIGRLVNLTHLDMSECPLLNKMPKGILSLTKLQVLSGFVLLEPENKNFCTLDDLKDLPNLRKLSIHTGSDSFPSDKDLQAFNQFKFLSNLTIAWGRSSAYTRREKNHKENTSKKQTLEKENEGESPKNNRDNDQSWMKYSREAKIDGHALQIKGPRKKSQETATPDRESGKGDKGKGILGEGSIQIGNPGTDEATMSICMQVSAYNLEKDAIKNNVNNEKNPNAQDLQKKGFKERLDRGLNHLLPRRSVSKQSDPNIIAELPSQLIKLDLRCFPGKTSHWLRPEKLPSLEKLYIRGGELFDIGQFQDFYSITGRRKWEKVKWLKLKYMVKLEIEWRELLELFPKLEYLEKVDCPKLAFFPCDESGIWTKKKQFPDNW